MRSDQPSGRWWQRALASVGVHSYVREDLVPHFDAVAAAQGRYVFVLDDDVSPMAAVLEWLEQSFDLPRQEAARTMVTVHLHGFAALGPYSREEAQQRAIAARWHALRMGLDGLRFGRDAPPTT